MKHAIVVAACSSGAITAAAAALPLHSHMTTSNDGAVTEIPSQEQNHQSHSNTVISRRSDRAVRTEVALSSDVETTQRLVDGANHITVNELDSINVSEKVVAIGNGEMHAQGWCGDVPEACQTNTFCSVL
jgi:hypothetical protein